LEPLHVSENRL